MDSTVTTSHTDSNPQPDAKRQELDSPHEKEQSNKNMESDKESISQPPDLNIPASDMDSTVTTSHTDSNPQPDAKRQELDSPHEKEQSNKNMETDKESISQPPDLNCKMEQRRTLEIKKRNRRLQRLLVKMNVEMTEKDEKNRQVEKCLETACENKSERESQLEKQLQESLCRNGKLKKNVNFLFGITSLLVLVSLSIILHFTFKGHEVNYRELRMMLVGKTGAGKSASGNTILFEEAFRVEASPASVTADCKMRNKILDGKNITIIDTPGVMDTWLISTQKAHHAHDCISMYSPELHVFLLVIKLGRFTVEESNAVKWIQENFGEEALNFTMILFTGGDLLKGKSVENFISNSYDLKNIVESCNGRYHVFNNYNQNNRAQVKELFEKVNVMLHLNMGFSYMKEHSDWTSKEMEIRQEELIKRKTMEKKMQMEERRKMDEMARKLRDEQYENKNLKTELNQEHQTTFWFTVSTGLLILSLIILICKKNR